ncbi:hypothetical protein [Psychrobacillus sp. FSL K6-1464]|uniref:hypothetical protein n=1 Tax=Psychrobacillus sp. FSL K6-1464 TaxID=2921545 RepID=UPI0030FAB81A
MNRLNKTGMTLIDYKTELMKEYPQIVRDALITTIAQMKEQKIVTIDAFTYMQDKTIPMEDFNRYLLTQATYAKSDEEMFEEFEVIRKDLMRSLANTLGLTSKSMLTKEQIVVHKKFYMDATFAKNYFQVEEKDIMNLMKRKGIVEKFAVLRLPKIIGDYCNKHKMENRMIRMDYSMVYYESEGDRYAIDLTFEIGIEKLEHMVDYSEVSDSITQSVEEANLFYATKMQA